MRLIYARLTITGSTRHRQPMQSRSDGLRARMTAAEHVVLQVLFKCDVVDDWVLLSARALKLHQSSPFFSAELLNKHSRSRLMWGTHYRPWIRCGEPVFAAWP